jgi:hypothetical protein
MGVYGVDESLESIGVMMQQTLCQTMKICVFN